MSNNYYYKHGAASGGVILFFLAIAISVGIAWGVNFYKLTKCDFAAPYKGEVIHGIGLVPAFSIFTAWFDDK